MTYSFLDALAALYTEGEDYSFGEPPYTYDSMQWLSGTKPAESVITAKIDELNAEEPYRLLRLERDEKLAACDWVTIKAYSQGVEVPADWAAYQQALRDMTTSQTPTLDSNGQLDPASVTWPTKPA